MSTTTPRPFDLAGPLPRGLTVLEAMWKGRPVVASEVGGIRDQIPDDRFGLLLADPADLAEFGLLIRRLLDDPELAKKLGRNGAEQASHFLPDLHLQEWAQMLTQLIAPRNATASKS